MQRLYISMQKNNNTLVKIKQFTVNLWKFKTYETYGKN